MDQCASVWSYDRELPASAVSASRARDFVRVRLLDHDLPHLVDDVQLAVSELATNALKHAATSFTVTLAASGDSVLVKVQDGSRSAPVPLLGAPLATAGRGLGIVAFVSREWGVTEHVDGGKTVWAAFERR